MTNNRKFTSATKFNYFRGIKPNTVKKPGSTFYTSLYSNSLLSNEIYNFTTNNPGPPIPPPPVYNTKIVAFLNLNDTVYDIPIKNTLEYYFSVVPEFYQFPIVNTEGNTGKTLILLDEYYGKGYRYFYGFSPSSALVSVLDWFNRHPLAQGVNDISRFSLELPKRIFRIQPQTHAISTSVQVIEGKSNGFNYDAVFYIYLTTNPAFIARGLVFEQKCLDLGIPFYDYGVNNLSEITTGNFVNITMTEIQNIISINGYSNSSIISSLGLLQDVYYNKFTTETTQPTNSTFYNINLLPNISEPEAQTYFNSVILYGQTLANLGSSPLWRQGYDALGDINYSISTLNSMELLYKLDKSNGYSNELGSYCDSLIFDLVSRDQLYESYVYTLYSIGNLFIPKILYYRDDAGLLYIGLL